MSIIRIANVLPLQWHIWQQQFIQPDWAWSWSLCVFRLHDLSVYVFVCFVLPWTVESFPFGATVTNLNIADHPLLNRRCTALPVWVHSPKCNFFNYLTHQPFN